MGENKSEQVGLTQSLPCPMDPKRLVNSPVYLLYPETLVTRLLQVTFLISALYDFPAYFAFLGISQPTLFPLPPIRHRFLLLNIELRNM